MTEYSNKQQKTSLDMAKWRNRKSNDLGRWAENCIEAGCRIYAEKGRAIVHKTPEPFRVMRTAKQNRSSGNRGVFECIPTEKSQPDFQGTIYGGLSIVFEVKATTTKKIERRAVTATQADYLAKHKKAGAAAYVCCYIESRFFMVPWNIWDGMKDIFGRQYVTAEDLGEFEVKFNGAVLFLDWIGTKERR